MDKSFQGVRPIHSNHSIYIKVAYPTHFVSSRNNHNNVFVLLREEERDYGDLVDSSSSDDSEENVVFRGSNISLYDMSDGMIISVRLLLATFWEPAMCGYAYIPSLVLVPNLSPGFFFLSFLFFFF